MKPESEWNPTEQVKQIQMLASRLGARLWRRNVGMGWIGKAKKFTTAETINVRPGDVLIEKARPFHNGEVGQSDTWGFVIVTITPEMVGQKIAQHVEAEAKQGSGQLTEEQANWLRFVNASGGRAAEVRSLEDVARLLA